jgi:broad specificity phosphatase PhoE
MLRIVLVRPGSTDFDEQGRIKGSLDVPLCGAGEAQVAEMVARLKDTPLDYIYASPGKSAQQTAAALAKPRRLKVRTLERLANLNHGLWHGKLIDEVKQTQPRVYRQWQEHPETVCPPGGESLDEAQERVRSSLVRLLRKHSAGSLALVASDPLATLIRSFLSDSDVGDLWKAELDRCLVEQLEIEPRTLVTAAAEK